MPRPVVPALPLRPSVPTELDREILTYKAHQAQLALAHAGRFALVHAHDITIHDTYVRAMDAGFAAYGLSPFLVKKIHQEEPILHFSRPL